MRPVVRFVACCVMVLTVVYALYTTQPSGLSSDVESHARLGMMPVPRP